jgi:hypothetical protein
VITWVLLARVDYWTTFGFTREPVALVSRAITNSARKEQVVPIEYELSVSGQTLGSKMFDVAVIDVQDGAFTIGALAVKHSY